MADRLGDTADQLAVEFFDARRDDPEPIHTHLLGRVLAIRSAKRQEIEHLNETVESLISDVGEAHFKFTQRRVREKIRGVLANHGEAMDKAPAPTWLKLVRAIESFHASSVWSLARGNGEGRSIDIYQVLAEFFREDAKERTTPPTMEVRTLLRELLRDDDMRQREMARSKRFVSEIVQMIDRQHETFLKKSNPIALNALKQAFQQDTAFWNSCAERWARAEDFATRSPGASRNGSSNTQSSRSI
jgi:hypothetical protein